MEEAREVEDVGPEEDAPGGARAEWEAEEPLEGGLGAAPEPAGVSDFGGGGEEDPGEDGGGDEGHGEAVEGWQGAEGDGGATAEEEGEEEVEGEGEEDVEGDGGEEEEPRGAPALGVAPTEPHDGWVLREVVVEGLDHRRHGGAAGCRRLSLSLSLSLCVVLGNNVSFPFVQISVFGF